MQSVPGIDPEQPVATGRYRAARSGRVSALYTVGVEPPSMRKVVPVMKSVSGLAKKQTAAAISIGCPSLLTVWCTTFLRAYCLPNSGSSLPCLCAVSMNHLGHSQHLED